VDEPEYQNETTHRRAQELARLAGETMTQAVDRAIAGRLAERLLRIGRECARLPVLDERSPEQMLYDDKGLPR
jgi:hypothetical protein